MSILSDGMEILKSINRGANADLYEKIGNYIEQVRALQGRVDELESANKELNEQLRFKAKLQRIAGLTYVEGDDEPICSRCAEVDHVGVHIHAIGMHQPFCPQCKLQYHHKRPRALSEKMDADARR